MAADEKCLSAQEVMDALELTRREVDALRKQGHLGEVTFVAGAYRFRGEDVDRCGEVMREERRALGVVRTAKEAATHLDMNERSLRALADAGLLPFVRPMGSANRLYRAADLEAFVTERGPRRRGKARGSSS